MAMIRTRGPMFRYGEKDFDEDYLRWGLHGEDVQKMEAQAILHIIAAQAPAAILDLACGVGVHSVEFARAGYTVTGVDISETFVTKGRELAQAAGVAVQFLVQDITTMPLTKTFAVVTWVEQSFCDESILGIIYKNLKKGGQFVFDTRNPNHPRTKSRSSNWRTWSERDGVFELERHETDPATGVREDVWITVDTIQGTIEEKHARCQVPSFEETLELLARVGFARVDVRTMEGEPFTGGEKPYWLWGVATK